MHVFLVKSICSCVYNGKFCTILKSRFSHCFDCLHSLTRENSTVKTVAVYKILNDHTAPGLRGSFVRREIDQIVE